MVAPAPNSRTMTEGDPPPDGFDYGEKRDDGQYERHPTVDEGEFVRPVRDRYVHEDGCGETTKLGKSIAESLARDPTGYSKTFCAGCGDYFPLNEFEWEEDGEVVGS